MQISKLAIAFFIIMPVIVSCRRNGGIAPNQAPLANAGPSQNVTIPATITVNGTGTDADGHIVAYLWSQVTGPNGSTITNPGSPTTTINGVTAGSYIFQLMVTDDDGATGVDTMVLKVNPAPELTLTLQPVNNPNDVALAVVNGVNQTSNGWLDVPILSWTTGGIPVTIRSLLKFDLSSIPQTSTIVSANLYLYSYPSPVPDGNLVDANVGSNNSVILQRVTSDWAASNVTWFNQPSGSAQDQVLIAHTSLTTLDLNLDVRNMISTMVSTNSNYGFLMKLQNETPYTSRIFVSSHSPLSSSKYPKLVVVYR
jgi:hypothetical protein